MDTLCENQHTNLQNPRVSVLKGSSVSVLHFGNWTYLFIFKSKIMEKEQVLSSNPSMYVLLELSHLVSFNSFCTL